MVSRIRTKLAVNTFDNSRLAWMRRRQPVSRLGANGRTHCRDETPVLGLAPVGEAFEKVRSCVIIDVEFQPEPPV